MPKRTPTDDEKTAARDRAAREFPGNASLQELHYIRYLMEIEWSTMTADEIIEDLRAARKRLEGR